MSQWQSETKTQTQTLGYSFNEEDDTDPWGRLCPTSSCSTYPVFEFLFDDFMLGRDAEKCEIELKEPQISAVHAKIVRNPNYGLDAGSDSHSASIIDMSTNGTLFETLYRSRNFHCSHRCLVPLPISPTNPNHLPRT